METLQVGNGYDYYGFKGGASGTLGSGNVIIGTNASLVFARDSSSNVVVAGDISGPGTLTQAGCGTLVVTGADSCAATTISTGSSSYGYYTSTLQIGNGEATGTLTAGAVSVGTDGTLAFDSSGPISVGSVISGAAVSPNRVSAC